MLYIDKIFVGTVINAALNAGSLSDANDVAFRLKEVSALTMRCLLAPDATRIAIENDSATSDFEGYKNFGFFLGRFNELSAEDRATFITSFRRYSSLAVTGINFVANKEYAWSESDYKNPNREEN